MIKMSLILLGILGVLASCGTFSSHPTSTRCCSCEHPWGNCKDFD